MRINGVLIGTCGLMLLLTGSSNGKRTVAGTGPGPEIPSEVRNQLKQDWWQAQKLFEAGAYIQAAELFEKGRSKAAKTGDKRLQVSFLNSAGIARFAAFQYRAAMDSYLAARQLAKSGRMPEAEASICSNISSVYAAQGDLEAARHAAEEGLFILQTGGRPESVPKLLIRAASLRARQGDMKGAIPLFAQGIDEADRQGDLETQAQAWNQLGYAYLKRGELALAEEAMSRDFRIRQLNGNKDIHLAYRNLGMLRLAQGEFGSAERLMDKALLAASDSAGLVPQWEIYEQRGRARLARGWLNGALADLRLALRMARAWRREVLPADVFRAGIDASLDQLYSSLVRTAGSLYFATGRLGYAREAFEAAEENRAASLRASRDMAGKRLHSSPAYRETLAALHNAQVSLLANEEAAAKQRIASLEQALHLLELREGLAAQDLRETPQPGPGDILSKSRKALGAGDAYLALHIGDSASYLWVVLRENFRMYQLPPRAHLSARSQAFLHAVASGAPEVEELGRSLYADLFGAVGEEVENKRRWLLALDDSAFYIPFPALVTGNGGERSGFLIERNSIQVVPGAHMLAEVSRSSWDGPFVGIGDGIYNTADPRWAGSTGSNRLTNWFGMAQATAEPAILKTVQMPRLPGSGREIRACASAWGASGHAILLEGATARAGALQRAIASRPSVLHFATHVISSRRDGGQSLIALGLGREGNPEFIGTAAIRSWGAGADVVVLSGCSTGRGPVLPGAGLMGLTRAWLAAGAGAVIASRWPTPDDTGELFLAFYRHLRAAEPGNVPRRPDIALQRAQIDMIQSGTWRSLPKYWAAYFVAGP